MRNIVCVPLPSKQQGPSDRKYNKLKRDEGLARYVAPNTPSGMYGAHLCLPIDSLTRFAPIWSSSEALGCDSTKDPSLNELILAQDVYIQM